MERPIVEYIKNGIWNSDIDEAWKRFLKSDRKVIIYGAGRQARIVLDFCNGFDKNVICLMSTASKERWGLLPKEKELPLYLISEFPTYFDKNEYDVIIALHSKYNEEVTKNLQEQGFEHIYAVSNWDLQNDKIRECYFRAYFTYFEAQFYEDAEGDEYLICQNENRELRMYYPKDEIFKANVLGELGNIVLPSMFKDERMSCLSPYEQGEEVCLHEGDVVLDLGANVGLFSCVAVAKGCQVYAFEPEGLPVTRYLKKNLSLNPEIIFIPYAIADYDGKLNLYYNKNLEQDRDTCRTSVHREKDLTFEEITVDALTIDTYVEKYKPKKIDFIKSHIEQFEVEMLIGAKKTLKKYAPTISMFSFERQEAAEKLLLEANPNYKIWYSKRRMFAYVPK